MRRCASLGLALVLAFAAGCARCGGRGRGPTPERFVPAAARVAVIAPDLEDSARTLSGLFTTAANFPGAGDLAEWRTVLTAQLGFDPLDPRALANAGFAPRRGAALAFLDRPGTPPFGPSLLVLPVDDAPKVEALVARIARERLGAVEVEREAEAGQSGIVSFRRAAGDPPALSYALADGTLLLARGPAGPAALAEALALTPAASLSESPPWRIARHALGEGLAAIAWAPPGSPAIAGLWPVKDGLALGFGGATDRIRVSAAVLLGAREPSFRTLAADGHGAGLTARLDPGAALVGVWDGDFAALGTKLVPLLSARTRARLAAARIDPQRDLFDQPAPGAAVSLSLAPGLDVAGLSEERVRADPLRLVELEAVATLKNPASAVAVSERLVRAADPRRRARPVAAGDPTTYRIETTSGQIAWRIDGDRLALAGGPPGKLDALLARLAGGGAGFRAPTAPAASALQGGLGGAVVDVQHLVASVRALPEEAFGTGPSGFVMRSVVDRLVEPATRLSAISLRARLGEGALRIDLEAQVRTDEGAP